MQALELAIDAMDIPAIRPFWRAVLGYGDEPGRMAELIGLDADGIVTDRPDLLRAELARHQAPLPAASRLPWPSGIPGWTPRVPSP